MDPNGLKTGGIDIFLYRTCCLILDILPMSLFLEFSFVYSLLFTAQYINMHVVVQDEKRFLEFSLGI